VDVRVDGLLFVSGNGFECVVEEDADFSCGSCPLEVVGVGTEIGPKLNFVSVVPLLVLANDNGFGFSVTIVGFSVLIVGLDVLIAGLPFSLELSLVFSSPSACFLSSV